MFNRFIKFIIILMTLANTANSDILFSSLRNKLAANYQTITKTPLKITDPLASTELWRFPKDNIVLLASNESFLLMSKLYTALKQPPLTQKIFNDFMATIKAGINTKTQSIRNGERSAAIY